MNERGVVTGQQELIAETERAWAKAREIVAGLDLSVPVYLDPPWTARDVLAHCAACADDAVACLVAHRQGGAFVVEDFDAILHVRNQAAVEASRALSGDQLRRRWIAAQEAFTAALRALDGDAIARSIASPWRDPAPVAAWVRGDLAHERGHIDDVLTAIGAHRREGVHGV